MALTPETLSRLARTMLTYFHIGSLMLKDNSSEFEVRNAGDTAYLPAGAHTMKVHGSNAANYVGLTAPAGLGSSGTFTLPAADGSAGQVMKTDGSRTLSFTDPVSNASQIQVEAFTEATTSPKSIFTPPANSTILTVEVEVTVAAAGGSPTVSVGTTADPDRDMEVTDVDLLTVGLYRVNPNSAVGGTPAEIFLTITPSAQSFTGKVRVYYGSPA